MQIKIVGVSPQETSYYLPLCSFFVNGTLVIDAGSLALGLTQKEQSLVKNILITHVHIDHIASLPLFIDYRMTRENLPPPTIIASPCNVASLKKHIFNNSIWPDLSTVPVELYKFKSIDAGVTESLDEFNFRFFPVNHPVPTYGIVLKDNKSSSEVIFTSDTSICESVWEEANKCKHLKAIFTEISFPDSLKDLAVSSGHLTPDLLKEEIKNAPDAVIIYITHYKPQYSEEIISQVKKLEDNRLHICHAGEIIEIE